MRCWASRAHMAPLRPRVEACPAPASLEGGASDMTHLWVGVYQVLSKPPVPQGGPSQMQGDRSDRVLGRG